MSLPGSNSALKGIKKKRAKNVKTAVDNAVKGNVSSQIMSSLIYSRANFAAAAA